MQIKRADEKGTALSRANVRVDAKEGHYDVQIKRVDIKQGIMICKLNVQMEKGGHYDVDMKGWMQKVGI